MSRIAAATDTPQNLNAYRCWSHHWCGCLYADDCRLNSPQSAHDYDDTARAVQRRVTEQAAEADAA